LNAEAPPAHQVLRLIARKNVMAGLMFIAIAALGLWLSRDYPVGTALRMSTGYVPRLLCWLLMGLGAIVLLQGLRAKDITQQTIGERPAADAWRVLRPIVLVTASLVAFGLCLERLGLALSILLLVVIASFATRDLKVWETLVAAAGLIALTWIIFILGLGLPLPLLPDW
jgi:hypothetical protein